MLHRLLLSTKQTRRIIYLSSFSAYVL
uniref:Uncharacterized protein n=1 Tax=Arundo donax TaxID=35708 RepID=A0A0A8YR39_ARUDO